MKNDNCAQIAQASATAKKNFEILNDAGIFPTEGELFLAKHRMIKAINAIMRLSKAAKWRGGVEV